MNEETKPFLKQGMNVYAQARETLAFFEQEMIKLLSGVIERREKWHSLKDRKVFTEADRTRGQLGYWVAAEIRGRSQRDEQVKIDCGIWWMALQDDDSPIVYASFTDTPKRLLQFSWNRSEKNIRSFDRWGRTFLYLPASDPADIGKSLNRLLDELLKQMS